MYKSLTNVALLENEWIGPGLIGTIEFESDGQYIFQGALIPTTERLFVNLEKSEGGVANHQINYTDISIVTIERRALSGKILNFWIDDRVEVSMNVTSEKDLKKFMEFYRKHRAHALKFEKMRYGKTFQI
ncbi:PH domain-containing protein [Salinicoccus sp. YB14-2]|uniref:PH domain-containing protein n=1 Tax=Salinicoccus sp. YB14-2 TaxID=1572701 RepID=UPI00068E16AF|nr:PH domain-containing protein [Salinicoccus sp. YB14-2]